MWLSGSVPERVALNEITTGLEAVEEDSLSVLPPDTCKFTSLGLSEGILKSVRVDCDVNSSLPALPVEDNLVSRVTSFS